MAEISQSTQKLIQRYQVWYHSLQPREGVSTIHVDEVASRVAAFYEKIRGVVEWREEHLMRRIAIERTLKRRLFLLKNGEAIASALVLELIRGGHFPNDKLEESKIEEVKKIIDKYIFILRENPPQSTEKIKAQLYGWLLSIAACEIEETLSPPLRETAQIEYMAELMRERIEIKKEIKISEAEKNTQIYIAIQRALFRLDSPIITYSLLKTRYPQWRNFTPLEITTAGIRDKENKSLTGFTKTDPELKEIAQNTYSIWESIEKEISHPLAEKFYKISEKYDTPYLILGDIFSEDPMGIPGKIKNPEVLESQIKIAYNKRLQTLKSRLQRAAIYATLSIFVTKILLALAVEVPFDKYITGQFNYFTLGLNILIPPLLMFFLVLTIRPPKKENLNRVIMEVIKIVYEKERKDTYEIRSFKKRGFILKLIITTFYLLTFVISFGLIIWGLKNLNFGVLSMIIFLIFFSLISFAGIKIRERSKELEVMEERAGFLTFLIDSFSLPILQTGKWLSSQLAKYNIVVVLITALIDLPFQVFIEFLEHWRYFLKEKKEEIH